MILVSLTTLQAHLVGHLILSGGLIVLIRSIHLSFRLLLKELRYFFILLLFIFIARSLSTPGFPVMAWKTVQLTQQGLYEGVLICWRLTVIVFFGLAFVSTTRTSEIKAAVEWILSPLPFVTAKRAATMISLTIRFLPMILNQAKETIEAQRARGIESRKNPYYRLTKFTVPLIRRIFLDAEKFILAMEARCYSDTRTGPSFSAQKRDWLILSVVCSFCIVLAAL
jgi:energy-coupling factor transporter transmembrane protein EcfT